jgi:3-oxoacyl-[acyl-carrier-protein] synthase III
VPVHLVGLATRLGVPEDQIIFAEDETAHTASVAAAFDRAATPIRPGGRVLLVAAGAGITAGAALYRLPH